MKEDPDFIEHHKEDLAASLEHTIVDILMKKLRQAAKDTGIRQVAWQAVCRPTTGCAMRFGNMRIGTDGKSYSEIQLYDRQCSHDSHYRIFQVSG